MDLAILTYILAAVAGFVIARIARGLEANSERAFEEDKKRRHEAGRQMVDEYKRYERQRQARGVRAEIDDEIDRNRSRPIVDLGDWRPK